MSHKFITISSLSSDGQGIGSLNGLKIFIDGALPGEIVEAEITVTKKNYSQGKLLNIYTPSKERVEPPCPVFGQCGGCQIMHLNYPAQLLHKKQRVIDALERIGGFDDVQVCDCLPSPLTLGYRNKIQLPVIWGASGKTIGLYRKETHEVIPLQRCLIQCSQGEALLADIKERLNISSVRYVLIRNAVFNSEAMVIFVTDGTCSAQLADFARNLIEEHDQIKSVIENINTRADNVILGTRFRTLAGREWISETLLGRQFKISAGAFFQVNPLQTERLYEMALNMADIQADEIVLDAYCGVGTLAIFSAEKALNVIGIECIKEAVSAAKENARLNHVLNASFMHGKAEDLIKKITKIDTVFLNPPRKGCQETLLHALLQSKPKKIIYISCDPATLARDLARLSSCYDITCIQPLDMFPQTMHVETIVKMNRLC